jgi:hypothetical protein
VLKIIPSVMKTKHVALTGTWFLGSKMEVGLVPPVDCQTTLAEGTGGEQWLFQSET